MKQAIIKMFDSGLTIEAIGDATELPQASVMAILLRAGKSLPTQESGPSETMRQDVVARYQRYEPLKVTTKTMGITPQQYWAILAEEGTPARQRIVKQIAVGRRDAEVVEMYQYGEIIDEIILCCGVSRPTIYRILKRNGIKASRATQPS